jgi:hypothetical protein
VADEEYSPPPGSPSADEYSPNDVGDPKFSPTDSVSSLGIPDQPLPPKIDFPANALPSDFNIMEVQPLTDEQERHRIAVYQSVLTLFAKQANNNAMMDQVQYCTIANAMLRLRNRESPSSLRKEGYSNINQWKKKNSIMQHTD